MSEAQVTVGQTVARARAEAGMTVAQVADSTRIRATLVNAIEKDDFRLCGGDVYARGHLKSIATSVGLDPAGLLELFDAQEGASRAAATVVAPIDQPTHVMEAGGSGGLGALAGTLGASVSRGRGTNWSAVMALALVVIVGVAAVSFFTNRPSGGGALAGPPATSPSASSSTSPSPETSPSDSATPEASPTDDVVAQADGVRVKVTVTGRASWMRVTGGAGGKKTLYEGTLTRGESQTFTDKVKVTLLLGNGGAVELKVNGRDLGAPGESGQVVKTSFVPGDPTTQTG